MKDFHSLKRCYKPKLLGIETIGLTCATRRLESKEAWKNMLETLIGKMNQGGAIKLHPSFINEEAVRIEIESIFHQIAPRNITLCDHEVLLELEMLHEKKTLIGSRTSLDKYALAFGSQFINIDLY